MRAHALLKSGVSRFFLFLYKLGIVIIEKINKSSLKCHTSPPPPPGGGGGLGRERLSLPRAPHGLGGGDVTFHMHIKRAFEALSK